MRNVSGVYTEKRSKESSKSFDHDAHIKDIKADKKNFFFAV